MVQLVLLSVFNGRLCTGGMTELTTDCCRWYGTRFLRPLLAEYKTSATLQVPKRHSLSKLGLDTNKRNVTDHKGQKMEGKSPVALELTYFGRMDIGP